MASTCHYTKSYFQYKSFMEIRLKFKVQFFTYFVQIMKEAVFFLQAAVFKHNWSIGS
jgi:hypothetical protein